MAYTKVSVAIDESIMALLVGEARLRNIPLQELVRAVVIPEWLGIPKTEKRPPRIA
jgi:hypothetical protein